MQFKRLFLTITFFFNLLLASFAQEPTLLDHGGGVRTVEFSPVNASLVASAGESNIIKLWNLQNDTVRTLVGHTSRVNSVTFSPNGEFLASVSDDRTLRLWSVQSQQNIATRNVTDRYQSVDFSPDGQMLATGGGRHVKLWNARNQTEIATLQHNQDVRTVAFSPDSQLLAAGDGSGDGPGTVKVWDVERRQVVISLNANPKNVKAVEFSSDNRYLASSGWNGHLKIWDVSNWQLLRTIPNIGHYDLAFSHDGKMIASTSNRYVSFWWVEDGASVARLPGPTDWIHPVDFSHDGTSLAVGAEDGIVRIWHINTSLTDDGTDGIRILHVGTYLQQLPEANSANRDNIPEPTPPPAVVRDYFELDPFYQQWIDVGGFPVIASAKVNPYALKEAAWLIDKMIGHRQDLLQALIKNKVRFTVIGYTEMTTQIPEYSHRRPAFYWDRRTRSKTEENLLAYRGDTAPNGFQLIHEFAHIIHHAGLNTVAPQFDNRLKIAYDAAMKQRLWQGSYASTNRDEYWAEGTHAWIDPKGGSSFKRVHGGNTRAELKQYDPNLAMLLTEVYGDRNWRYTPIATRTHLPHLRGFNPQDSPTFRWPQRLEEAYAQLRDPSINRGEEWINLKPYNPNQLSQLIKSQTSGNRTHVLIVNLAEFDVLVYQVHPDGAETFKRRIPAKRGLRHAEIINTQVGSIYLTKDQNGRSIAVFRAEAETGRILIGTASNNASPVVAQEDVSRNDSQPQVLIAESQRPPLYWVDTVAGTLHRLTGEKVETLVPSARNATSLAVDMAGGSLYWTEKTSDRTGKIRRANLDGTNVQLVKDLTSVPQGIALDTANGKIYLANSWGKVQRLNLDGSNFQSNLITDLDMPKNLALDVSGGKVYWTEMSGRIRRANLDGSHIQDVANGLGTPMAITVFGDRVYWTVKTGEDRGEIRSTNLIGNPNVTTYAEFNQGFPIGIAVDTVEDKLYWTTSRGKIGRGNIDESNFQPNVVTGLNAPGVLALGVETEVDIETKVVPATDAVLSLSPSLITSPAVGELLTLNLNIAAGEAVAGYQVTLQFDAAALGYVESSNGDYLPTGAFFAPPVVKRNRVELASSAITGISNGDGTLATVTFEVLSVKASTLTLSDMLFADSKGNTFRPRVEAGEISDPPKLKADINGDGVVNIQDLVLVSSNFGKAGQNSADVNADGIVNIADLVLVAGSLSTGLGAPSWHPSTLERLTAADVHAWLSQARQFDSGYAGYQQGLLVLEQLLVALIPKETILFPNYPNPFNPETWIPYQLAKPADVTLRIYAANGALVRTLALGHQPAGIYQNRSRAAYWDGRNEWGEKVASSIYFYTLTAGEFTATRKMLIRK